MKITVHEDGNGAFVASFDEVKIELKAADLKQLAVQTNEALVHVSGATLKSDVERIDFIVQLRGADDVGVQAFIQAADHDDIVVLLKVSEHDDVLHRKLIRNMSETNSKIFLEDMEYKFHNDVDDAVVQAAFGRLVGVVEELEANGRVIF